MPRIEYTFSNFQNCDCTECEAYREEERSERTEERRRRAAVGGRDESNAALRWTGELD